MKINQKMVKKQLRCLECGDKRTIVRAVGRNKRSGHLKTMWCRKCRKQTQFEEE